MTFERTRAIAVVVVAFALFGNCANNAGSTPAPVGDSSASGTSGGRGSGGASAGRPGGATASGGQGGTARPGMPENPMDATAPPSDPATDAGSPSDAVTDAAPATDVDPSPEPTKTYVYVAGRTEIGAFELDLESGKLTPKGTTPAARRTSYIAVSPNRRFVYAEDGSSPGRVLAFSIDKASGGLELLNEESTVGGGTDAGGSHIAVHPSGKYVLVSGGTRVSVLPIAGDGRVQPLHQTYPLGAEAAHQVTIDVEGRNVFVPSKGGHFLAQLLFDVDTGNLSANSPAKLSLPNGSSPRHIAIAPNRKFAYLLNEATGTAVSYGYDAEAGKLSDPKFIATVPGGFDETGTGHILVHPSGKFVYASNRFHNSIAIFRVDAASGRLAVVGHEQGGGDLNFPRDFALDPTGTLMVVGNERANSVSVFRIDQQSGRLEKLGPPVPAPELPLCVIATAL